MKMVKSKIVSFTPQSAETIIANISHRIDPSTVDVVVVPRGLSEEEVCRAVEGATLIMALPGRPPYVNRRILEAARGVKLVHFGSVGYDNIDLEAATELGVPVANNPGWASIAVAEHTLMLILSTLKKALYVYTKTVQKGWEQGERFRFFGEPRELRGKTLGILGLGAIGREVAKLAGAFGAKILYNKRSRLPGAEEEELGVEYRTFDRLLEESDIITVHVPLTDETRGMIGKDEIAKMKDGAIIVNTARNEVVDESAVREALKEGKLSGWGTDFEPDSPLTGLDHIMMTPHTATITKEALARSFKQFFDNICRLLEGNKPDFLVNDVWA